MRCILFAAALCGVQFLSACQASGTTAPPLPPPAPAPTPANPPGLYVLQSSSAQPAMCAVSYSIPLSNSSTPVAGLLQSSCGAAGAGGDGIGFDKDGVLYINSRNGLLKVSGGLWAGVTVMSQLYFAGPLTTDSDDTLYGVGTSGNPPYTAPSIRMISLRDPNTSRGVFAPGQWAAAALVLGDKLYYSDEFHVYAYTLPLPTSGSVLGGPELTEDAGWLAADAAGNLYVDETNTAVREYATPLTVNAQPLFVYPEGGSSIAVDSSGDVYVAQPHGSGTSGDYNQIDVFLPHTIVPFARITTPLGPISGLAVWQP